MKLIVTFTDGRAEEVEIDDGEWETLDDLLGSGFSGAWLRFTGDATARWYRTGTLRSIDAQ